MGLSISPMRIDDYEEVLALWQGCEGVGLNESDSRDATAAYLARNPQLSLVARSDGELIACVLCGHDGRRGYLHHLAVDRAWRRQGIGTRLVTACLEQLSACGIAKCNIFLYADNSAGREFWLRGEWHERGDLLVLQRATTGA